jgi:hypothetical protein
MRPRNALTLAAAVLATLLGGCAPAPATPIPESSTPRLPTLPPASDTPAPSLTPSLTPTTTPTGTPPPTPAGALTRGPYLQLPTSDSIVIVWETDRAMPGEVFYGQKGSYDRRVVSTATGLRHEVTLSGLEPGTEYGYWIATLGYRLAAAGSFRTAPPPEAAFTFAAFGDTRSGHEVHRRIAEAILTERPDFALHTGDLVAYGAQATEWDRFFEIEHGLLASVPLFPSPGNHEQNARRYFDAFVLPGNERWYTFEWGNARFISLQIDAIVPFGKQSEQVQWLEATLAANTQPWVIVWFHVPPFDAYTKTDLSSAVRINLVSLFERYGVDLVISGHSHNYQRSNVNGVTYIITAGGGAELNPLLTIGPELEAGYSGNHFVLFRVNGETITGQAISLDGEVVDEFRLEASGPGR